MALTRRSILPEKRGGSITPEAPAEGAKFRGSEHLKDAPFSTLQVDNGFTMVSGSSFARCGAVEAVCAPHETSKAAILQTLFSNC